MKHLNHKQKISISCIQTGILPLFDANIWLEPRHVILKFKPPETLRRTM